MASHFVSSGPARPAGGGSLRSRFVRSAATRCWFSWSASVRVAYVVPERHRFRNPLRREAGRVRFARLPRTVRRLVVHHQKERLLARPALDELEGEIGDDIRRVAARIRLLSCRRVEHRIPVCALAREDLPAIEPGGIASEMPLADHAGVVPALLQQPRDRHPRAVEPVEHRHAVQVEYWPVRIAARLGVQIEFVAKTLVSSAPSRASRSMCGVLLTRDP